MSDQQPFFSRRLPFFGSVAVVILCGLFFLMPFGFRGARVALSEMRNEVADWLPSDFPETRELDAFRSQFVGSQFVVLSWDGCNEGDERYKALLAKLKQDTQGFQVDPIDQEAKRIGDRLGLHATGDFHETFSTGKEKWLIGDGDEWYYLTENGELYRWTGGQNLVGWVSRSIERWRTGTNRIDGDLIYRFPAESAEAIYRNPRKLDSRLFKQLLTGPEVYAQLAGPGGSLVRGEYDPRDPELLRTRIEAHQRLTGVVFGPTPARDFDWTRESFLAVLPEATRQQLPDAWEPYFDDYVRRLVDERYGGRRRDLLEAHDSERLEHWYRLFFELQIEAPPRPTCIVAALSDVATRDLSRVVGRPDFFKPVGRIYQLAEESGLSPAEIHLGGPPVDNVAIDEEGTITLVNLVSLSTAIGLTLAYISFRSISVTLMIFFVGGVSAVTSLGFVWFGGSSLDAVLLSMPSLVYVLGLSGAVHIVNYYREECHESGERGASERALSHGWFACTLAAFTTALGLISLTSSNLVPIQKFGLFSAIGTMATLLLLFLFLPSALTIWSPGYRQRTKSEAAAHKPGVLFRFWDRFGAFIVRNHTPVIVGSLLLMVLMAVGMTRIKTSVQLLKLFDDSAKVIGDYEWLEANLGRLVPMELVVNVSPSSFAEAQGDPAEMSDLDRELSLNFLERLELSSRVRQVVEREFGEEGRGVIGPGMSTDVMVLPNAISRYDSGLDRTRSIFNDALLENRPRLDEEVDYFRIDPADESELWRISLRLGAFNDVDYGRFVADLQQAVEPVLTAYRHRDRILRAVHAPTEAEAGTNDPDKASVLIVGWKGSEATSAAGGPTADSGPASQESSDAATNAGGSTAAGMTEAERVAALMSQPIDQTAIFCRTLGELLENRGFTVGSRGRGRTAYTLSLNDPRTAELLSTGGALAGQLDRFACVVLVSDPGESIRRVLDDSGVTIVDATDHVLRIDPQTRQAIDPTAAVLRRQAEARREPGGVVAANDAAANDTAANDDEVRVSAVYTGIVPIVYKAQRTLLASLADSISMSFWMIATTMMVLLRDWRRRVSPMNLINISGGLVSMLPNLFPILLIFGIMGWADLEVDIGSMMTASVALGVAVDDTIHFLSWFRAGMRAGLDRITAIRTAYAKVATAMTQTTLIAGLGLSAFAFSTFTPTQRFGLLMLTLLFAALIGDLIMLPALLASRLGKFLEVSVWPPGAGKGSIVPGLVLAPDEAASGWASTAATLASGSTTIETEASDSGASKSAAPSARAAPETSSPSGGSGAPVGAPHGHRRDRRASRDR